MTQKKALIIGHTGQDGYFLSNQLKQNEYLVFGLSSSAIECPKGFELQFGSISDKQYLDYIIKTIKPDEVYYLAAVHNSSSLINLDENLYERSMNVNSHYVFNMLNAIKTHCNQCVFFYASSSHIFGNVSSSPQTENTLVQPKCIYGISKVSGMGVCRYFNQNYNIKTICGIFYNHESERRAESFVTKKIVKSALDIKRDSQKRLILGNIKSEVDWGFAPDYMEAVRLLVQKGISGDYIIATNTLNSIEDFLSIVFNKLNLKWQDYVVVDPSLVPSASRGLLQGDYSKLHGLTGWKPTKNFEQLVNHLVEAELSL